MKTTKTRAKEFARLCIFLTANRNQRQPFVRAVAKTFADDWTESSYRSEAEELLEVIAAFYQVDAQQGGAR